MGRINLNYASVLLGAIYIIASSCNNGPIDIPFPVSDSVYPQPVSQPLVFGAPRKLNWITTKTGRIKTSVKRVDIEALPGAPYDTSGFEPFGGPPIKRHFILDSLPSIPFSLDSIASKPLHFKTELLPKPITVTAPRLIKRSGSTLSVYEFDTHDWMGLIGKNILCMLQDRNGLIWIGTSKGLYRYDGENIITFGDFSETIMAMAEDDFGRIWYLELGSKGMGVIDPANGTISRFQEMVLSFHRRVRSKIFKDDKGRIWVFAQGAHNAIVIDPVNSSVKHLDESGGIPKDTDIGDVFQDKNKNIWLLSSGHGANIMNLEKGKISFLENANGLITDSMTIITGDKAGRIWLCNSNNNIITTLEAVDLQVGTIMQYNIKEVFAGNFPIALLCDDSGRIWIGSNIGLELVDPGKGMFRHYYKKDDKDNDIWTTTLFLDNRKRLWVGKFFAGGGTIKPGHQLLSIMDQNGEMVYHANTSLVTTILEDSKGRIWDGTEEGRIEIINALKNKVSQLDLRHGRSKYLIQNIMELDSNIWIMSDSGVDIINLAHKTLEHIGRKEGLNKDIIYGVLKDERANTWFIGHSGGIDIIDSAKTTLRHSGIADGLSDNQIIDIRQDRDGLIWLANNSNGVDVIDPRNGTIRNLNNVDCLNDSCNKLLLPGGNGRMWIGTNKGIYIANTRQGTLTKITTEEGLSGNHIYSILPWNGCVLVGTDNKVTIITPPATDNDNAGTKASNKVWKTALLAGSEGLSRNSEVWGVDCITKAGQYLWGQEGITFINDIKQEDDSSATFITAINVIDHPQYFVSRPMLKEKDTLWFEDTFYLKGQQPLRAGFPETIGLRWDSVSGPYNLPVNLHIPYNQNIIRFQFIQAHLGTNDSTLYCYTLQGIDRQWSSFTNKTATENYLNLQPGKYTFKVRSKGLNRLWGKPASFSFTITPPWWQSWWAFTSYTIIAIASLWGFIHLRSKKLLREKSLLEHKVKLRTAEVLEQKEEIAAQRDNLRKTLQELQTAQKQLIQSEKMASLGELTAGIAHEIQNPLNFMNNFSEVNKELIEEMEQEIDKGNSENLRSIASDIKNNEEKISHHGKRADAIVKGMLQHSRTSTGQNVPTDINALADEYLRLAYHGLRAKDKSFNATILTNFDPTIGLISIIPHDIGRVLLNLYNNAFYAVSERKKQRPEGYEPNVSVSTKKNYGKVIIRVKDNGNGISQKVVDKIFQPFFTTKPAGQGTGLGLSLSYDIVKAHGGEIRVDTKEEEFTEFEIQIPAV